jgi:5-methylcytosine-specific restriction endonuclease McrA
MNAYGYKDLVAASEGRLEPAETVHHIVPTSDDPSQFYSFENLIPVSRHTHDAIHDRYRESEQAKRDEQARLRDILQVYRETH